MRVLNQLDYSLVNQLQAIETPSAQTLETGRMLCEFLHLVRTPTTYSLQQEEPFSWS